MSSINDKAVVRKIIGGLDYMP